MVITGNIIAADEGKALHRKGEPTPTMITRVALAPWDVPDNWEDCEYGEGDEPTIDDANAALCRFGVEV